MNRGVNGTYALVLEPRRSGEARIGKLGALSLDGGWLVYVGSAFGSGGLSARLRHHLHEKTRPHWHIDHLLPAARIAEVWYTDDPRKREEEWADALRASELATTAMRRFGSGDCKCEGHLFRTTDRPRKELLTEALGSDRGYVIHTVSPAVIAAP